jgi:NADPH:quinone reductase-like Zn-dependent oxidoreductase
VLAGLMESTPMKSAFAVSGAGIDAIEIEGIELPEPGPGEALVRLKAATLNFRDQLFAKGILKGMTKEPRYVPLSCAAGEVIAVGDGVTRVSVGDRVNPIFHQGWTSGDFVLSPMLGGSGDGVARTHATFPAEGLSVLPDELGDLEAATLPCAGLTAWSAVFGARPIAPGEWVLVQGTGGVSLAALQWAKAAGANVVVTSSSDRKLARAQALGADVAINYVKSPDWHEEVRSLLRGGVDIVVDVAGAPALEASAQLLNEGGMIAAIGMLAGDFSWSQPIEGKQIVPINVGSRQQHEEMLAFAARHRIRPVVDAVYDLDRLKDALRHAESGDFVGKIGVSLL